MSVDVLLVNARLDEITKHAGRTVPLGLAYIGAILIKAGYTVSAIDLNATPMDNSRIIQAIKEASPVLVGISACTPTYPSGLDFARLSKEINTKTKIIFGGAHASVMYREVLQEECVDIVVRGEGEYTMLDLADCFIRDKGSITDIKGIAYKDNGCIVVTQKRNPITNPDELPFPAKTLFPLDLYGMPNAVLASRGGCPFACYFCAVNNIWEGRRYFRQPENIIAEISELISVYPIPKARVINFSDDAFTMNREQAISICRLMRQLSASQKLWWRCNTRVDLVDAELLNAMRYSGCYSIEYGIEAGSQRILDAIGKKISMEQIRRVVGETVKLGIDAECSFMFPHPEDTKESIREQIGFMRELHEMGASETLSLTTPLPGTELCNNAEKLGVKVLSRNWDEYDCKHLIIATKYLSNELLMDMYQEMTQELGMHPS